MGVVRNAPASDYPIFKYAKVTAQFKYFMYEVMSDSQILANPYLTEMDRFTERRYKNNVEAHTTWGFMTFVATHRQLSRPPSRRYCTTMKEMIWHDVPCKTTRPWEPPNLVAINKCLGRVNKLPFDVNEGNHFAGTALCVSVDAKPQPPKVGATQLYYDIAMRFLIMDNGVSTYADSVNGGNFHMGHNFVFDSKQNQWDLIIHDGTATGHPPYQAEDLNILWQLDQT
jgi:hypothetical protein